MISTRLHATSSMAALALCATPAFAGEITGIVVDETNTVALQSATISIEELGRQVVAERDGRYRIVDLPAGTYTLVARYVGVPPVRQQVVVPESATVTADFALGGEDANVILVVGQAANQSSALSRKRAADTVSDVLTRDAIGQFPDQNVAESLRRLPGINVLNDQGEGRFVSVRGLAPALNSTSINGLRVPAPESDTRAVALDVVSSDIIESIEVKKSLTPDMDADTLGASIEINTVSVLDRRRDYVTLTAEGSYGEYAEEFNPKASVNFGYRLSDSIGISGGASFYERFFETDNIEADGWEEDDGLVYADDLEYRDYDVERQRISGSLGLDVRVSDTTDLFVRGLYSRFDDQEYRRGPVFDFGDANVSGSGLTAMFDNDRDVTDEDDEAEIVVEREIKDRFERQEIYSLSLGGETRADGWFLDYQAGYSLASEKEDDSIDPTLFEREFFREEAGDPVTAISVDYSDPRRPMYSVSGISDFLDAETYEFAEYELTDLSDAEDEEFSAEFDVGREFAMAGGVLTAQAGFKGRWREKTYDKDVAFYEGADLTVADVLGEQTYRITDIGPVPSYTGASDYFFANRDDLELIVADSQFDSAVEDYGIEEDIYAGYGLLRWDDDKLSVIGGLRWERTYTDIEGNSVLLVEEGGEFPSGDEAEEDTVFVSPTTTKKRFNFFAPSVNIRFEPQPGIVTRLAAYRSLVRPGFGQLAPRFATERNDDDEIEGEFGNPDLSPYRAWNFDASAEYYFSNNGAITAAVFYKDIEDYIVDVEYEAEDLDDNGEIDPDERLVYRGISFNEAVIPLNGRSAEAWGVELGVAQQWSMLPAPFDGLITQANYTYTDASGTVPDGGFGTLGAPSEFRTIPLPNTSEHTFNAVLGYEKGPFSFRLAGTYRDDYLDELGSSAELDRYVDSHFQLDLSAKFRLTDNVQLFYEWINITDAEYFAYNTLGSQQNLYQYEIYGWTMKGGVKVTF